MKYKPLVVFEETDKKVYWRYENGKEDKSRRKAIPNADKGQVLDSDSYNRLSSWVLGVALRSGSEIFNMVNWLNERKDMLGIYLLIIGVWVSGFLAAKEMAFWSLLVLIVSFVLGAVLGGKK